MKVSSIFFNFSYSYLATVELKYAQDKDDDGGYDLDKISILSCISLG